MARTLDLSGHRYGSLKVIDFAGLSKGKRPERLWRCLCDCGQHKLVRQNNLRSGHTVSCGCYMKEQTSKAHKKHGRTKTSTYVCWRNMKSRCSNPKDNSFANYGAKGITVCKRWLDNFEHFLGDMGEKPGKNYSIERIDPLGNYEPSNCKWATTAEQNRNYSRNVWIEHNGKKQCVADWAAEVKICPNLLHYRLKAGWAVGDALYLPVSLKNKPSTRTT